MIQEVRMEREKQGSCFFDFDLDFCFLAILVVYDMIRE